MHIILIMIIEIKVISTIFRIRYFVERNRRSPASYDNTYHLNHAVLSLEEIAERPACSMMMAMPVGDNRFQSQIEKALGGKLGFFSRLRSKKYKKD